MKLQIKTPPTANQKTHVLVPGDVVLRRGGFWEVLSLQEEEPSYVAIRLRNQAGEEEVVADPACRDLGDVGPEISNKYMWWRVVNMGA